MNDELPHLIVVDVETSGLDPHTHDVLEVAAIDLLTGDELYFVPFPTNTNWRNRASAEALGINRYFERGIWADECDTVTTRERWTTLDAMLAGNIIAGANPWFDATFIDAAMRHHQLTPQRKHQLRDLATYAHGVLGTAPAFPLRAGEIFATLGIANPDAHSALGDARATAEAFTKLRAMAQAAG